MKTRKLSALLLAVCLLCGGCAKEKAPASFDGSTVAVGVETDDEIAAEELKSLGANVVTYTTAADAALAVEGGKADFLVTDELTAAGFTAAKRSLVLVRECAYQVEMCAAFSQKNGELCESFNGAIRAINDDGTAERIRAAWLAGEPYRTTASDGRGGTALTVLCSTEADDFFAFDEDGEAVGIEPLLLKELCGRLGYTVVYEVCDFDELFSRLEAGEGDVVFSFATATPELADSFLFSDPYFTLHYGVYERG